MVLRTHGSAEPDPGLPGAPTRAVDVLAGYRARRAQQALFDVRGTRGTGYDEFIDPAGAVRPAWQELADGVGERGFDGLDRLRATVRNLVDDDGITFVHVDHDALTDDAVAEPWRLDGLPLLISTADWDILEA